VPQAEGLPRVLVISTTNDPATPYQAGVNLAKALGASLLTVNGTNHTAYLNIGSKCVDRIGTDYLTTLELPASDTTCR
jgi:predicted esterase